MNSEVGKRRLGEETCARVGRLTSDGARNGARILLMLRSVFFVLPLSAPAPLTSRVASENELERPVPFIHHPRGGRCGGQECRLWSQTLALTLTWRVTSPRRASVFLPVMYRYQWYLPHGVL